MLSNTPKVGGFNPSKSKSDVLLAPNFDEILGSMCNVWIPAFAGMTKI
jgi:hypothetical protein